MQMGLVAYRLREATLRLLSWSVVAHACGILAAVLSIGLIAAPGPAAAQTFQAPQGPSLSQTNQTFSSQGLGPGNRQRLLDRLIQRRADRYRCRRGAIGSA